MWPSLRSRDLAQVKPWAGELHLLSAASRLLAGVETARLVFARDASAADVVRARRGTE
ncbi:MAG TPA: hypothetical protein VEU33_49520 [Archangium sp.]|nr:hypothetical protein [Archangium sp.]